MSYVRTRLDNVQLGLTNFTAKIPGLLLASCQHRITLIDHVSVCELSLWYLHHLEVVVASWQDLQTVEGIECITACLEHRQPEMDLPCYFGLLSPAEAQPVHHRVVRCIPTRAQEPAVHAQEPLNVRFL